MDDIDVTDDGEGSVEVSAKTKKPRNVPSCTFTEAIWNISLTLSYEQQIILQEWVYEVEYSYIANYKMYSEDDLVVLLSLSLKEFSVNYTEIWEEISFKKIDSWGYCNDFLQVGVEIKLEVTSEIVEIDANDNCDLFDAMRNATQGNPEVESDCEDLIAEMTLIFKKSEWSYEQKMGACSGLLKKYFELNVQLELILKQCTIEGYGSFESFIEATLVVNALLIFKII